MRMEEHFKETLNRAVANEPPVMDAWDRFEQRAGRGRRVRLLAAFAAAAAVAVASVIVVPKLGTDGGIGLATQPPSSSPTVDPYEGWQTFTNPDQHYRVKYPADWNRTMFEAVFEFVPPGLPATDARGAEGSFGVIFNVHPAETIEPPLRSDPAATGDTRASDVVETRDGSVLVITHLIDWSRTRCITLGTTCPQGDALVLTVRINGEDSREFMGTYRALAELIVDSVEYVP